MRGIGHLVYSPAQIKGKDFPHLWLPLVYLKVSSDTKTRGSLPTFLPRNTVYAIICISNVSKAEEFDQKWDLCFALENPKSLPTMEEGKPGWLTSSDINSILTAADIFTHSAHAKKIEQEMNVIKNSRTKISVIVCTYKREEGMQKGNTVFSQAVSSAEGL